MHDPTEPAAQEDRIQALLARVYADPAAEPLRRVVADALLELGSPRGELIALQLEQEPETSTRERIAELLAAHAERWLGPLRPCFGPWSPPRFQRGFPASGTLQGTATADPSLLQDPRWSTFEKLDVGEVSWGEELVLGRSWPVLTHLRGAPSRVLRHGDGLPRLSSFEGRIADDDLREAQVPLKELVFTGERSLEYLPLDVPVVQGLGRLVFWPKQVQASLRAAPGVPGSFALGLAFGETVCTFGVDRSLVLLHQKKVGGSLLAHVQTVVGMMERPRKLVVVGPSMDMKILLGSGGRQTLEAMLPGTALGFAVDDSSGAW